MASQAPADCRCLRHQLAQSDLLGYIEEARQLGMHEPAFPPKEAA